MSQLPKIGRYSFRVEQYQCNVRKMLRFSSLVNIMLSAADYHSTERGFGTIYLNEMGKTWVLSRLAVEMERIPSRHQEITIETWIDKVHPDSFRKDKRRILYRNRKYRHNRHRRL